MVTQAEYDVTKQRNRTIYAKIILLNFNFQQVDEWQGVVTGTPTFSNDSNSDIRRTCNISLIPTDKSFDIAEGNKIWLDKYIQIYLGIKDIRTKEIVYTNMGIYLINNPKSVYSATQNTISINGVDLMAKMTGMRNGNLEGVIHKIEANTNVREAIIGVIKMAGFNKYVVEECPYTVPNEIKIDVGKTVYDILKALKDIDSTFQMYFDVDGVFHYNKIPTGDTEPVMVTDDIWNSTLISYEKNTPFEDLKNVIEVFGKTHDIDNYGGVATLSSNTYSINVASITEMRNNLKVGFVSPETNIDGEKLLKINNFNAYPILNYDGSYPNFEPNTYYVAKIITGVDTWDIEEVSTTTTNIATINGTILVVTDSSIQSYTDNMTYTFTTPIVGTDKIYNTRFRINDLDAFYLSVKEPLKNNTTYTVTFKKYSDDESKRYFYFMGEVTPYGYAEDDNEDSPYYVEGTVGRIRIVLQGGEYDNIYTSDLARQRAEYELYLRCKLKDSISLTCVPIYWLDTNWIIEITLPNKQGIEETNKYIIKSINTTFGTSGTQTISCMRYYPLFPNT